MKIQHLAIIFIIIIVPISLVVGQYIQTQIDTINMQSMYSKKLKDATLDAVKAFQINTINNKYSSVSDSKIRDIEASVKTFYNSLGVAIGGSGYTEELLKSYVPAMVYTMYDGYYIYGKYFDYDKNGSAGEYKNGLKPYIYYACRYKKGTNDFVVNYTLDNSITIYGKIGRDYETKSGYVINPNLVAESSIKYITPSQYWPKLQSYSSFYSTLKASNYATKYPIELEYGKVGQKIKIQREILTEQLITVDKTGQPVKNTYQYVKYGNQKIYKELDDIKSEVMSSSDKPKHADYFTVSNNKKEYLSDDDKSLRAGEVTPLMFAIIMTEGNNLYSNSAAEYYAKAREFSQWISANIGDINQSHAVDSKGNAIKFASDTGNANIFNFGDNNNPLLDESTFNEHRLNVIRNSITTNLTAAIASFNTGSGGTYEFRMPVLMEQDWDKLLNNISLTVFLQGLPMKSKVFNSYCIVTNNKNEEVVTKQSIYMLGAKNSGEQEVHLPGCTELVDGLANSQYSANSVIGYNTIDFERQSVVISQNNEAYYYPHADSRCYNCIVNTSQNYDIDSIIDGKLKIYDKGEDAYIEKNTNLTTIRTKYLTALARERYDLYRTNASFGIKN